MLVLRPAQVRPVNVLLTLEIVLGLVAAALWLWMARANGHGRNWARILSTVLFGLATLEAIRAGSAVRSSALTAGMSATTVSPFTALIAAPAYMSLTAVSTGAGAGGRGGSVSWPLDE